MKIKKLFYGLAAVSALAWSTFASAATIIEDYTFTAATSGPISSHSGSFSISYESASPTVRTLRSINFSVAGTAFDLTNTAINSFGAGFIIGGTPNGVNTVTGFTNDFWLFTTNGFSQFAYGSNGFAVQTTPNLSLVSRTTTGAVPEPETWALLLLGFVLIGSAMRRRNTEGSQLALA